VSTPAPVLVVLRVVGGLVVTVAVLTTAWGVASGFARATVQDSFSEPGIRSVEVDSAVGRVIVERGTGELEASVTAEGTWGRPAARADRQGDTLRLTGDCGRVRLWGRCSVEYRLAVPDGVDVTVRAAAGQVQVSGIDGDLTARVNAGEVRLRDLRSQRVDASTDAGQVRAEFSTPPRDVRLRTSTGAISVTVPDDGTAYAVSASADLGAAQVDVPIDPTSERRISATTSVGAVDVRARQ
jgi:hypothetical protein